MNPLAGVLLRTSNPQSGLIDRVVGQQRQKTNRVEDVRLAYAVHPRDAGVGTKIQREINQILEAVYFYASQHAKASPTGERAVQGRPGMIFTPSSPRAAPAPGRIRYGCW